MTVNKKIFEILEEKGISQHEFARMTGITQSTISDWKNKGTTPNAEKIPIICKSLNISINELFDQENEEVEEYVIRKGDAIWEFVNGYYHMEGTAQKRMLAYAIAIMKSAAEE